MPQELKHAHLRWLGALEFEGSTPEGTTMTIDADGKTAPGPMPTLLLTAAVIMCFYLGTSSLVTTLLIPAGEFQPGGAASGRALAYLAHRDMRLLGLRGHGAEAQPVAGPPPA